MIDAKGTRECGHPTCACSIGRYYTPDWLAEHVLDRVNYTGNPDKRILDPACGSGTFLVMAMARIRRWYDENREKIACNEAELCRKILANVVGFELNPTGRDGGKNQLPNPA